MKKFTLSVALLLSAAAVFSQSMDFVQNGQTLENNATIPERTVDEFDMMDAHVKVKNNGGATYASLTVTVLEEPINCTVGYCGFGTEFCSPVAYGKPITRNMTVPAGEEVDPKVEIMGIDEENTLALVQYELKYGDATKIVTINFALGASSISSSQSSSNINVYQNELTYSFDSDSNRQIEIYSITGERIISDILSGANGTLSLSSLNKGFYIYSVLENDKVTVTRKFSIK